MLNKEIIDQIISLKFNENRTGEYIAKKLGITRVTVRKYVKEYKEKLNQSENNNNGNLDKKIEELANELPDLKEPKQIVKIVERENILHLSDDTIAIMNFSDIKMKDLEPLLCDLLKLMYDMGIEIQDVISNIKNVDLLMKKGFTIEMIPKLVESWKLHGNIEEKKDIIRALNETIEKLSQKKANSELGQNVRTLKIIDNGNYKETVENLIKTFTNEYVKSKFIEKVELEFFNALESVLSGENNGNKKLELRIANIIGFHKDYLLEILQN